MQQPKNYSAELKAEKLAWKFWISSAAASCLNGLIHKTPSGLEEITANYHLEDLGFALTLGGMLFAGYAITNGKKSYANMVNKDTTQLHTKDANALMRHPIYAGFRMGSLGLLLSNPSIENIFCTGCVYISTEIAATMEEKRLIKDLGQEYLKYQSTVPKWIPTKKSIQNYLPLNL